MIKLPLAILIVLILMSACSPTLSSKPISPQPAFSLVPDSTSQQITVTSVLLQTPTIEFNKSTPTHTPTTHQRTPTPIRTLAFIDVTPFPVEQAKREFLLYLATNAGCNFPCFLGLTPGRSQSQELAHFFNQFHNLPEFEHISDSIDGAYYFQIPTDDDITLVNFIEYQINSENQTLEWISNQLQFVRETDRGLEIVFDDPSIKERLDIYSLKNILVTYGRPDDVRIWVNRAFDQFNLLFFYPQQGFIINLIGPVVTENNRFLICPSISYIEVWFWPENQEYSLEEASIRVIDEEFGKKWIKQFHTLETASEISFEEFESLISDPNNEACLSTPINLWPPP